MSVAIDLNRPDVNGIAPRMQSIRDQIASELDGMLPYLTVSTDDNFCSSITIRGTKEPREQWGYGYFENASCFLISIAPANDKRYYTDGDKLSVDVICSRNWSKFRKYSGDANKIAAKVKSWILTNTTVSD